MLPNTEFEKTLVAGNVKAAMKDANASSRDLWHVDTGKLRIIDGFNIRVRDDSFRAHIRSLANSMKAEGYYQDKPMAGYVAKEGDELVIYITDGHCRYEGVMLANSEGAEINRVPVVVSAQGTSMEDLTVALVKSNTGKPLTPYEVGIVCKRLSRFGWTPQEIAKRLDISDYYVDGLLMLMAAPAEIREMVIADKVSASFAIQALRSHGEGAAKHLQSAIDGASGQGKARASAKHLPGHRFYKAIKKAAPNLYETLAGVQTDAGYKKLSPPLREKIDSLIKALKANEENGVA